MSNEKISAQIRRGIGQPAAPSTASAEAQEPESQSWLGKAASTVWERVNPIPQLKGLYHAAQDPAGTLKNMGAAQDSLRLRAVDEYEKGNYVDAARAAMNWAIPILGPESNRIGDVINEKGATSPEAVGELAGLGVNLAAPAALSKAKGLRLTPKVSTIEPRALAALEGVEEAGGSVGAGLKTGNRALIYGQEAADTTILGSQVQLAAARRNVRAMRSRAEQLADQTGVETLTPEAAGTATRSAIEGRVKAHGRTADTAYGRFRDMEANPRNMERVPTGEMRVDPEALAQVEGISKQLSKKSYKNLNDAERALVDRFAAESGLDLTPQPVMVEIQMPVDLRGIKGAIEPILEDTKLWPAAERTASKGYSALKEIRGAPDFVPASLAEKYLGGLKDLSKAKGRGVGRTENQGLAGFAVGKLQDAIDTKVAGREGARGLLNLRKGRRATALKWGTDDIVKALRDEPVQLFNQTTWAKDAGIGLLRKVWKESPNALRKTGRAWLDDVFRKATLEGEGGLVTRGRWLGTQWNNLGPSTRKLLFAPTHAADLDRFFLGLAKLGEIPNPSGSGVMALSVSQHLGAISLGPVMGTAYILAAGGVSKMLRSPAGTRALIRGLSVPLGNKAAAGAAISKIVQLAGEDARPIAATAALPKAAEAQTESSSLVASR